MSFQDNELSFSVNWSTPTSLTTTADFPEVVDVTGAGVNNAPTMIGGYPATNTAIGADIGAGDGVAIPYLYLTVTTTGTGTDTITFSLSAAPDNGSYGAGNYTQIYESRAFVGTSLKAGQYLIVPVPPTLFDIAGYNNVPEVLPRFYKLTYTTSGTTAVSALAGLMLNPPSSLLLPKYPNNFLAV